MVLYENKYVLDCVVSLLSGKERSAAPSHEIEGYEKAKKSQITKKYTGCSRKIDTDTFARRRAFLFSIH